MEVASSTDKTNIFSMKGNLIYFMFSLKLLLYLNLMKKIFLHFNSKECFRCILIMQKHPNVLQYRASKYKISDKIIIFFYTRYIQLFFSKIKLKAIAMNRVIFIPIVKTCRLNPS